MWFALTLHFGRRTRHEARQVKFGGIALKKDEASGEEYLEWTTERESKTRHGDEMNTEYLFVRKRTKQATRNVQCLATNNLSTGDRKKPNRRKAHSS